MDNAPIFIGGISRSGKSLIQTLLEAHPNISISAVGTWTYFYGKYGDLGQPDNFERCLGAMLHYKPTRFLKLDPNRIRQEFWRGEPTYARLFASFQQYYAETEGKSRWGDQGEFTECYTDLIFAAYPKAKIIYMIRDPRDRYEASLSRWQRGRGKVGGATAIWLYSAKLGKYYMRRYPDRYMMVHYETLVAEPEKTLREVCAFLGEDYMPAMLTKGSLRYQAEHQAEAKSKSRQSFLSTDHIGRFHTRVPKSELAFIQAYAKREMVVHNYDLEPLQFSLSDRLLFYLADQLVNLVYLVVWYLMVSLFPTRMARTPRSHKLRCESSEDVQTSKSERLGNTLNR